MILCLTAPEMNVNRGAQNPQPEQFLVPGDPQVRIERLTPESPVLGASVPLQRANTTCPAAHSVEMGAQ